jgi:alpha,alpha-trehalase
LQAFLVQGLHRSRDVSREAEQIALNLAQQWINTTYEGYRRNGVMYEKVGKMLMILLSSPSCTVLTIFKMDMQYSAIAFGSTGGGGEYNAQTGFGWTNGFCMELFSIWGPKLE